MPRFAPKAPHLQLGRVKLTSIRVWARTLCRASLPRHRSDGSGGGGVGGGRAGSAGVGATGGSGGQTGNAGTAGNAGGGTAGSAGNATETPEETSCGDGCDNDGDTFTDCNDRLSDTAQL
jgi:hypothetical protein